MKKLLLALSMFAGVLVAPAVGTEYYVSTGGSDANDGTSRETAFATIAHAVDVAADGDTVRVLAGTYAVSAAISVTEAITIVGNTANTHSAGVRHENRAAGNSTAVGIVINTIAAGNMKSATDALGTLNAILPQPYPQLFVVGIGPAVE